MEVSNVNVKSHAVEVTLTLKLDPREVQAVHRAGSSLVAGEIDDGYSIKDRQTWVNTLERLSSAIAGTDQ